MATSLGSTAPNTTFGEMMGHLLKGNSNAFFASLSDAATLAKTISGLTIGASAMAAGLEVYDSQTPITEGQKQGFALGGLLIGGEAGGFVAAALGTTPWGRAAGVLIGSIAGSEVGKAFYDNVWADVHDDIINNAVSAIDAAERAYQAAKDYVDNIWDETGTAAQNLFADFLEGVDDFVDGLGDLAKENNWPPIQLPDWLEGPQDQFGLAPAQSSPLVVDLDSDGVELTTFAAATTTTFFDIDGDGFAEQTAWVSADDGLLVRDLNANGTIDDVDELFGSPTIDGFALLAELDSNGDLRIDASDTDWGDLRIWQDANGDAVTQSGELLTLSSLNIVSIDSKLASLACPTRHALRDRGRRDRIDLDHQRQFDDAGERLPPDLSPSRSSAHPLLRGHPATPRLVVDNHV